MRTNRDEEEPDTQTPQPKAEQVGHEFNEKGCIGVAHVAMRENLGASDVAEMHETTDSEAAGTHGDELLNASIPINPSHKLEQKRGRAYHAGTSSFLRKLLRHETIYEGAVDH